MNKTLPSPISGIVPRTLTIDDYKQISLPSLQHAGNAVNSETMSPVSLVPLLTPALLSSLRTHPRLPRNSWYFITAVTLSILNRPDSIPHVFRYVLERGVGPGEENPLGEEDGLHVVRRMRESLIKSSAVVGLPKVR